MGWPCGARLRTEGGIFHKWTLPVAASEAELDEDAVVEHLLECAAADAVAADGGGGGGGSGGGDDAGGGGGDDDAGGEGAGVERSSTFVERIVFARLGATVEALGRTREQERWTELEKRTAEGRLPRR